MAQFEPYLSFDGNCAEAMRFYERVLGLGAKLEMMMSGADSPMAAETPQEKAVEFMLFDLSSCVQNDTKKPEAPPTIIN